MVKKLFKNIGELALPKTLRGQVAHYIGGLYRKVDQHHVFLLAGGLAFSLFACIIPLLFIIFAVLGSALERIPIAEEISVLVDRLIPYPEYASSLKEFLFSRVDEFRVHKNLAGIIGFVGLLFASRGLFSSMRTILNTVYEAHSSRPAIVGVLRDMGLVVLVLLYFLLSTTVIPVLGVVKTLALNSELLSNFRIGFLQDLAVETGSFLLIVAAFYSMYFFIPQIKLRKRVIGVSALSAAVLWQIAEHLFGFYLTHAATLKRVYGAFTLLIVVALWIYYTSIVFIISAEIGQLFRERMRKRATVRSG